LATDDVVPLQWPLVGRAEEVGLFGTTLADPRAHGFLVYGDPGVGKTRLADQLMAEADARGRKVARATASEGLRTVPLGALAHLLPPSVGDARVDMVKLMSEVRPVLVKQGAGGPLVLLVDDLHLLDATSGMLIGQLLDADLLFLVATVRDGEGLPAGLDAVWQRGRVRRVDLHELDRGSIETLMQLVLGGPVEQRTVNDLWRASGGSPMFVRELVLGALNRGHLNRQHGVWRLAGRLVTTRRLRQIVENRIGGLPSGATEALDCLAMWEPATLAMLEDAVGREQLELLDRLGLLVLRADSGGQRVGLSHPLYGEILRARLPALKRRRLLLELAERIDADEAQHPEDAIRSASCRLEATGSADPQLLLRAARLARYGHDFVQVERLARGALKQGMTSEVGLLLGEALSETGRFVEANRILGEAVAGATDDDPLLVYLVELRARNLMWGLLGDEEALVVNASGRDRLTEARALEDLTLNEALLLTYSGRPGDALTVLNALGPPSDDRAKALRGIARVPALIATGRPLTAAAEALELSRELIDVRDQIALPHLGVLVLHRVYGLTDAGQIEEAGAIAAAAYDRLPPNAPPDAFMWLSFQIGRCALHAGRPATARRWLGEALARCDASGHVGPSRLVLSGLATAHAYLGDAAAANEAIDRLDQRQSSGFARPEQELGRAWALVAQGDLPGARAALHHTAELAHASGYAVCEATALHDVARLGDPTSVSDRLTELAQQCEGSLVDGYARRAVAARLGDPQGLVEATDHFDRIGARLLAAELAMEAAQAFQDQGDRRSAGTLRGRAEMLAGGCEGARTPGLAMPVSLSPLSPRERDIATLAARGESSKAIAERLFLSVRTVNNHLGSIYTKLGISSRGDLAARLASADVEAGADGSEHQTRGVPGQRA
jgi:DNA-binding CsgD family transcriptional regulator